MADGRELPQASEVPIARQDPAFVICDEVRLAALREAEQADSLAAEFVAVSVAFHLWQAQQQAIGPLMERAVEETRNGYNARPFTDWIQRWGDEMSKGLVALGERNNALVAQLGKCGAEEIGTQQAVPRLEEVQTRIDAAESATTAGMLGDLQTAQRHDEALEPVQASTSEVEIRETEKIRLRKLTGAERSGLSDDHTWAVALAEGNESVVIGLPSDQDLSDALDDQWERPALLAQLPDQDYCFAFKGRYFVASSLGRGMNQAFERLSIEPRNEAEVRAFAQASLPAPRSHLERLIALAHEIEDGGHAFGDVLEHIELERAIYEDDDRKLSEVTAAMREDLRRGHESALLTTSELAQCLHALGDAPMQREIVPQHVRHVVWRRDRGRCVQCGSQERLEFDHIVPFSRGGSSTERNLQLLCERCNRSKGATI